MSRCRTVSSQGGYAVLILLVADRFIGTSVAVFGAVNSNRGMYRVTFDGISEEYVPSLLPGL